MKENTTELVNSHPWNVITEDEFKQRMSQIFNMVAKALRCTVGPYGAGTLIESMGTYSYTKDGYTVLKNIHFNNRTDNTFLNLILTISHQMVMNVGDGSTTAILAAHAFLDKINKVSGLSKIRSKDLSNAVQKYVGELCGIIQKNAKPVTDENLIQVIERVARIATNSDEQYTQFIRNIYEECGADVTITKKLSPTAEASYEIKNDMFYTDGHYVDEVYCNAEEGKKCIIENPVVLMFNFTLEDKHWQIIQCIMQHLTSSNDNRRLVVLAPHYDQFFMDHVKSDAARFRNWYRNEHHQAGAIPFPIVFVRNPFITAIEPLIFEDLTAFLGSNVMNPLVADELLDKIGKFYQEKMDYQTKYDAVFAYNKMKEADGTYETKPYPEDTSGEIFEEIIKESKLYLGECKLVSIGSNNTEFSGFYNKDEDMIEVRRNIARGDYARELADIENLRYVNKQYIVAKERLARLACVAAIIYVGGNTDLEKSLNETALDDAIKACNSAIKYGYNIGNNLAILRAIEETEQLLPESGDISTKEIAHALKEAFIDVITMIHNNKYEDSDPIKVAQIVETCLKEDKCFDLITEKYSDTIINSCRTDIEILRGAISIIGTLISANQYLAIEIKK